MSAVLFGSISSMADTSELQRDAFNRAFAAHGLDWRWDRDQYRAMLDSSGGANRIAEYAASRGESVDAQAVHETKSALFQESLATAAVDPRSGVVETIRAAKDRGWKVGLVTSTSHANVVALLDSLAPPIRPDDFDVVVDSTGGPLPPAPPPPSRPDDSAGGVDSDSVAQPKPEPEAYTVAVTRLAEDPGACVAVEDNLGGVRSARAAGVPCVAFPNVNTAGHDFGDARVVERLDLDSLAPTS